MFVLVNEGCVHVFEQECTTVGCVSYAAVADRKRGVCDRDLPPPPPTENTTFPQLRLRVRVVIIIYIDLIYRARIDLHTVKQAVLLSPFDIELRNIELRLKMLHFESLTKKKTVSRGNLRYIANVKVRKVSKKFQFRRCV